MNKALIFSLTALSSCSIVEISRPGHETQVDWVFGPVQAQATSESEPVVTKIRTLGFIDSPLGTSIGYSDQIIATLPASCRAVFWIDNQQQLDRIESFLDVNNLCSVYPKRKKCNET